MKTRLMPHSVCTVLVLAAGLGASTVRAQLIISVDMDTAAAGIQNTRNVVTGDTFDVGLVFNLAGQPGGISSYGVSVRFKNTELQLNGSPAAIANGSLPGGLMKFSTTGVGSESNDIGGGLGQVSTFDAGTFGMGPTSGTFSAGTMSFKVLSPVTAAGIDITPGLFATGFDGLFDNVGSTISSVTFEGGSAVPEPSTYTAIAGGLLAGWALLRRVKARAG